MTRHSEKTLAALLVLATAATLLPETTNAGVVGDLFKKITGSNNKTDDIIKQSAPVCGSLALTRPDSDKGTLSPEFIFITNLTSRNERVESSDDDDDSAYGSNRNSQRIASGARGNSGSGEIDEVAQEFRFHQENVTLKALEKYGFNPDAPTTFLLHGFTSGYPLQTWISAIVESYTIVRETSLGGSSGGNNDENRRREEAGPQSRRSREPVSHNLFIVNWNYAARGILYPRAVANIPIVAAFVTRFINDKLVEEAGVDPRRIQLIGHSLGAHLAGFIGKNTRSKLGRIYGLDPAGPCFGAVTGSLFPESKRLGPDDAEEVITIHTNSGLLGIDKPLGKYSVFVEGGVTQPGCKGGGVLDSLNTLTWDGGSFDSLSCSHSRAPNLLTYRHDQSSWSDDCQLVAYECNDWESYFAGQCGVCQSSRSSNYFKNSTLVPISERTHPLDPVECLRIGLDWQYPKSNASLSQLSPLSSSSSLYPEETNPWQRATSTTDNPYGTTEEYENYSSRRPANRRPYLNPDREDGSTGYSSIDYSRRLNVASTARNITKPKVQRERRQARTRSTTTTTTTQASISERRVKEGDSEKTKTKSMFLRTSDTQPYCVYQYQVVLELNEPFPGRKQPSMSLILQDSEPDYQGRHSTRRNNFNSLSSDEFGTKFNDKIYTHLLTSGKKLGKIDHATMLFREKMPDGHKILKALHVNYMSSNDPRVRQYLSTRFCPVRSNADRNRNDSMAGSRYFFEPCDEDKKPSSSRL